MDDLESLAYMIVYFLRGSLPWQNLRVGTQEDKYGKVLEVKMSTSAAQLCQGIPYEILQFVQEVKTTRGRDRPDYKQLRRFLRKLAMKNGWKYDNVFDWTICAFLEKENAKSKKGSSCIR